MKLIVPVFLSSIFLALLSCERSSNSQSSSQSSEGNEVAGKAATSQEAEVRTLKFSAIPDQNSTELKQKFAALSEYLSRELGIPVEYVASSDYKASVEMFRNGDIHLAWFGGLTGVQARESVAGARAIAQGIADPNYLSYFIAHQSTGLEKSSDFPKEIAKMSFTYGSESSTSGRLMPQHFIAQQTGVEADDFFTAQVGFSGSHDKTVELVESGQVQTGVVNYKVYDKRVAASKTDPEVCKVIWVTPPYADYNFTAHPELDDIYGDGFISKLQKVLMGIKDPELLSAFPRKGMISAKNEDFEGIRQIAIELGFLR